MLGVESMFSGVDFERLSRILNVNHNFPRERGLEKYRPGPQKTFWPTYYVRAHIDKSRGEDEPGQFESANERVSYLKRTEPEGEMRMTESRVWNKHNPFHLLIVGGGPAGYELTKQLKALDVPCVVHMSEKHSISTGLVLGAISPLHDGTKRGVVSQYIQMLDNGNDDEDDEDGGDVNGEDNLQRPMQYYGECRMDQTTLQEVAPLVSVVADCTGAMKSENCVPPGVDPLNVIIPTSRLIRAYNRVGTDADEEATGDTNQGQTPNWPLSLRRNHPVIAGVGLGNAMADHITMLLADRMYLEDTDVNPRFLDVRDRVRPEAMRIFIRGEPHKLAADTKVLKELLQLMADRYGHLPTPLVLLL